MLKFVNNSNPSEIGNFIAERILEKLEDNQKVLWLVPGGSAIIVAVAAAKVIATHDHHNLTITLSDERYGLLNHPDSNWRQLRDAGFSLPEAKLIPVLTEYDLMKTNEIFAYNLERAISEASYVIALLGLGADGHTAGILPNSLAVSSPELTCAYEAGNYKRITITPVAAVKINEAIVFAQGESKWPALKELAKTLDIKEQPAQILKQIEQVTIFTDYQYEK